ncbi:TniQ family protein [Pseudooceanicola sp. LIPI14-2-Ac024]|uniref:TniQ family protein n=1 Tax=Pseudooceanicola sp. LIPI14-2-Ac024 TaxID=3344875 RepID=UPI0035CF3644
MPHHPSESSMGFAARLGSLHTGGRTRPFLSDIGVKFDDLARGQSDAVRKLADIADVSAEAMIANTPRGIDRTHYDIRGEIVSAEFLASPYTVFCPVCLVADDQASGGRTGLRHYQWIWQLNVVRTCPEHGLPLMRRKAGRIGDRFHELAIVVPETGPKLSELAASLEPRAVSPLQAYALDRLEGKRGPAWLDSQDIDQAVRASEMLGALALFGPKANLDKFTACDWDRAGAAGYAITAQGEDGIRRALTDLQSVAERKGDKLGPQAIFGRLYQWLSRSRSKKDPGDIKRILRDHIVATMELSGGTSILGEVLPERRLHTCATLASEMQLDARALWNVLVAKGLIPADAKPWVSNVFDAARGREVALSVRRLVTLNALPEQLGCTRPLAEDLVRDRILAQIAPDAVDAPGRLKKSVDERDVDALLARVEAAAVPVEAVPADMVDLAIGAMKSRVPACEIVHLILAGKLSKVVRVAGTPGFAAIHVDAAETKAVAAETLVGLSPAKAFGAVPLPDSSGWELIRRGYISVDEVRGDGDHVIQRIRPEAIEAFLAEFTTETIIGKALGMGGEELKAEMKRARAKVHLRKRDIGIRIFRRSELPERFQV